MRIGNLGQSLIEALIALGAASIIVGAIAIAVITSVNNADFGKNQNLATQFSQQGMEVLKSKSQSDWASFSSLSGTYCLPENSTTLTSAPGSGCTKNVQGFFVRDVTITQLSGSCSSNTRVIVSTSWADGKCTSSQNPYCHTVDLESCLANINSTTSP